MLKRKEDLEPIIVEQMKGGVKYVKRISAIGENDFTKNAEVVSKLAIVPGASIGYHEHVGNEEVMLVLSGQGTLVDDGEEFELHEGDVTICREHHHHSVINTSEEEDLVLLAVVVKTA